MQNIFLINDADRSRIREMEYYAQNEQALASDLRSWLKPEYVGCKLFLSRLDPVYIKDVSSISKSYRSLIFNSDQKLYASKLTPEKIVDEIENLEYNVWKAYWRKELNLKGDIPYVYGKNMWLKINQFKTRKRDWLNLDQCRSIQLVRRSNDVYPSSIHFFYKTKYSDVNNYQIVLNKYTGKITRQIRLIWAFKEAWLAYDKKLFESYGLDFVDYCRKWRTHPICMYSVFMPESIEGFFEGLENFLNYKHSLSLVEKMLTSGYSKAQVIQETVEDYFNEKDILT